MLSSLLQQRSSRITIELDTDSEYIVTKVKVVCKSNPEIIKIITVVSSSLTYTNPYAYYKSLNQIS